MLRETRDVREFEDLHDGAVWWGGLGYTRLEQFSDTPERIHTRMLCQYTLHSLSPLPRRPRLHELIPSHHHSPIKQRALPRGKYSSSSIQSTRERESDAADTFSPVLYVPRGYIIRHEECCWVVVFSGWLHTSLSHALAFGHCGAVCIWRGRRVILWSVEVYTSLPRFLFASSVS